MDSIRRAIHHLGYDAKISQDPSQLDSCSAAVLPGVGAFGDGMANLKEHGWIQPLKNYVHRRRPLLGICLGMQLMTSKSEEFGTHEGLNFIPGRTVRFAGDLAAKERPKIPHVGWSKIQKYSGVKSWKGTILEGLSDHVSMYFTHSYYVIPENTQVTLSTTLYGGHSYCSTFGKDRLYGTQFHPEMSGELGLRVLKNYLRLSYLETSEKGVLNHAL